MSALTVDDNIADQPAGPLDLAAFAEGCRAGGLRNLSGSVAGMIRSGVLRSGQRLPTIRDCAALLGLSPGTVASAWAELRDAGMIETRRRGGSFILPARPGAFASPPALPSPSLPVDLAHGGPDAALQPPLREAMLAGVDSLVLGQPGMLLSPLLEAALRDSWPFAAEAWTTTAGGTEGILLALEAAAQGGPVAVEDPTSPRLVEAIRALGLTVIPIPWDAEGPAVAGLRRALEAGVRAFAYQPRAHLPLGRHVSPRRAAALAGLLADYPDVVIVEDDCLGPLAAQEMTSLGAHFGDRTLLVRTYCRAFGVQLKVCAIGGGQALIRRLRFLRSHGSASTSLILEGALAHLLVSRTAAATLSAARARYAARRAALVGALAARGLELSAAGDEEGPFLWLPAADETRAVVGLSGQGVVVSPGAVCSPVGRPAGHICIGVTRLPDDPAEVARIAGLAAAAVGVETGQSLWI